MNDENTAVRDDLPQYTAIDILTVNQILDQFIDKENVEPHLLERWRTAVLAAIFARLDELLSYADEEDPEVVEYLCQLNAFETNKFLTLTQRYHKCQLQQYHQQQASDGGVLANGNVAASSHGLHINHQTSMGTESIIKKLHLNLQDLPNGSGAAGQFTGGALSGPMSGPIRGPSGLGISTMFSQSIRMIQHQHNQHHHQQSHVVGSQQLIGTNGTTLNASGALGMSKNELQAPGSNDADPMAPTAEGQVAATHAQASLDQQQMMAARKRNSTSSGIIVRNKLSQFDLSRTQQNGSQSPRQDDGKGRNDVNVVRFPQKMQQYMQKALLSSHDEGASTSLRVKHQVAHVSALSSHISQLSNTPDVMDPQQYGPDHIQLGQSRRTEGMLRMAQNLVTDAYGDPRESLAQNRAGLGAAPITADKKIESPQNLTITDEDEDEEDEPLADAAGQDVNDDYVNRYPARDGSVERLADAVDDSQKGGFDEKRRSNGGGPRSPFIPKLNLVQIGQDPKLVKNKLDTSIGAAHQQNLLGTAGSPSLMATPGQHHHNLNSVALMQGGGPPLTSHYPILTSCSPDKRVFQFFLYCMNNSNRSLENISHASGRRIPSNDPQRQRVSERLPQKFLSAQYFRASLGGISGQRQQSRQAQPSAHGTGLRGTSPQPQLQGSSFSQQRSNMILKLKQFHTQMSDLSRRGGMPTAGQRATAVLNPAIGHLPRDSTPPLEPSQDFSDPQLQALMSEANQLNESQDGLATGSNMMRDLSGTRQSRMMDPVYGLSQIMIGIEPAEEVRSRATKQLTDIGQQLGECFLAKDLPCLLRQQREMELQNDAEQDVLRTQPFFKGSAQRLLESSVTRSKSEVVGPSHMQQPRLVNFRGHMTRDFSVSDRKDRIKARRIERVKTLMVIVMLLEGLSLDDLRIFNLSRATQCFLRLFQQRSFQLHLLNDQLTSMNGSQQDTPIINIKAVSAQSGVQQLVRNLNASPVLQYNRAVELQLMFKILQKFSFANEDIMRRHVHNQFTGHIHKQKPGRAAPPPTADNLNKKSAAIELLDEPDVLVSNDGVVYDMTNDHAMPQSGPTQGQPQHKEAVRRRMDPFLYQIAMKIRKLISRQAQSAIESANQPTPVGLEGLYVELKWVEPAFTQALGQQLLILSTYLKGQSELASRVLLAQVLDVVFEPLLMVKRLVVDVTLRQRIFDIDQSKPILPLIQQEFLKRGVVVDDRLMFCRPEDEGANSPFVNLSSDLAHDVPGQVTSERAVDESALNASPGKLGEGASSTAEIEMQGQMGLNQVLFRNLTAQLIECLTCIVSLAQTSDSLKLINESFVGNAAWQTAIESYIRSLSKQDIISTTLISFHKAYSKVLPVDQLCIIYENFESLRGMNMLNFDEVHFKSQLEFLDEQAALMIGRPVSMTKMSMSETKMLFWQLHGAIKYQTESVRLLKRATQIYFPDHQLQEKYNKQGKQTNSGMNGATPTPGDPIQFSGFLNRVSHAMNPSRASIYHQQSMATANRGMSGMQTHTSRKMGQMDGSFYSALNAPQAALKSSKREKQNWGGRGGTTSNIPIQDQQQQNDGGQITPPAPPFLPQNHPHQASYFQAPDQVIDDERQIASGSRESTRQLQGVLTGEAPKLAKQLTAAPPVLMGNPFSLNTTLTAEQKYWKHSLRKSLNQLKYLFHHQVKEIPRHHRADYSPHDLNRGSGAESPLPGGSQLGLGSQHFLKALLQEFFDNNKFVHRPIQGDDEWTSQISLPVMTESLQMLAELFELNEKFTKYLPIDEVLVYYLRLHHTNFVRLYNENKRYLEKIEELKRAKKETLPGQPTDQLNLKLQKQKIANQNSLLVCKQHLKCIYAIARTRTEDIRQRLFQMQLFHFVVLELNLEHEYLAQRKKYLALGKKAAKEVNENDSAFDFDELYSPTVTSKRRDELRGGPRHPMDPNRGSIDMIIEEQPESYQVETGNILHREKEFELHMIGTSDAIEFQDQAMQSNVLYDNARNDHNGGSRVREVTPPARSNKFEYNQQSDAKTDGRLPVSVQPNVMNLRYGFDSSASKNMQPNYNQNIKVEDAEAHLGLPSDNDDSLSEDSLPLASFHNQLNPIPSNIPGLNLGQPSAFQEQPLIVTPPSMAPGPSLPVPLNIPSLKPLAGQDSATVKHVINQMSDLHDIKSETEIESNVLESVHSKKLLSQKSNGHSGKDIDSDSSGGLPPPLPIQTRTNSFLPALRIGGLGLSTLAKGDNDKTAEQLADMAVLNQDKKPAGVDAASSYSDTERVENMYENASSSSDAALPPPIPVQNKMPRVLPKLAIGGLGLSTVAKVDGGKTAEEMADAAILAGPKAAQQDASSSGDDAEVPKETDEDGSSSDAALPPPLPIRSTAASFMPKLAIGGLGLSTVAKDGTQTAEQMADAQLLNQSKAPHAQASSDSASSVEDEQPQINKQNIGAMEGSDSSSDAALPPPLPVNNRVSSFLPKLAIGGLGLSTVAKTEGGKTAEEIADMQMLNQGKAPLEQTSDEESKESSDDAVLQQSPTNPAAMRPFGAPEENKGRYSFDSSSSDGALPPPLPIAAPKKVLPLLAIGGLGLSTVKKDGELQTQEEIADASCLQSQLQQKKGPPSSSTSESVSDSNMPHEGGSHEGSQRSSQSATGRGDENIEELILGQPTANKSSFFNEKRISNLGGGVDDQHHPQYFKTIEDLGTEKMLEKKSSQKLMSAKHTIVGSKSNLLEHAQKIANANKPIDVQNSKRTRQIKINSKKLQKVLQAQATKASQQQQQTQVILPQKNSLKMPKKLLLGDRSSQHSGHGVVKIKMPFHRSKIQTEAVQSKTDLQELSDVLAESYGRTSQALSASNRQQLMTQDSKETMRITGKLDDVTHTQSWFLKPPGMDEQTANEVAGKYVNQTTFDNFSEMQQLRQHHAPGRHGSAHEPSRLHLFNYGGEQNLVQDHAELNTDPVVQDKQQLLNKAKTLKFKKVKHTRISKEDFYQQERAKRPLYQDEELHCMILSLALSLLLKPQRGTLDELYCRQYPINDGKENYLYIMHQHFSHDANQYVINNLLKEVSRIQPPLASQRLLKLMCPQLFDLKLYNSGKDWRKLAVGAYGTVYECKTNLIQPKVVAIKQMDLPADISGRCVLHDIFNEITCLEQFRLERCVTDLYDYGVDQQSYYIIMKRYALSLGEWRRKQGTGIEVFRKNLRLYVSIYLKVLKSLRTIHAQNVTHYDIKCDNVLINFPAADRELSSSQSNLNLNNDEPSSDMNNLNEDDFEIAIGDFGECKIFFNEKDEFCTRNLGTDCIKSPEMLQLTITTCKVHEKYDRRKQVGTNRLSDIWSVGCLFYELCTGEFLLYEPEWPRFFHRVISHKEQLITKEKLAKIDDNQYIKDFLKFILIRDQRLRPTIDKVIKQFELIHAIMCNLGETESARERTLGTASNFGFPELLPTRVIKGNTELHECLHMASKIARNDALSQHTQELSVHFGERTRQRGLTKVLESVYLCCPYFLKSAGSLAKLLAVGVSHMVVSGGESTQDLRDKFELLLCQQPEVLRGSDSARDSASNRGGVRCISPFQFTPVIMDFLRKVTLYKGKVVFVERANDNFVKECLLIALNNILKTNIFETYTLIKSQSLSFDVQPKRLAIICEWNMHVQKIRHYLTTFPQFSCHCGASLIILERSFAQYQNIQKLVCCNCCQKVNVLDRGSIMNVMASAVANGGDPLGSCPCGNNPYVSCQEYLSFLEKYYCPSGAMPRTHIEMKPFNAQMAQLVWAFFDESDFILGPRVDKVSSGHHERQNTQCSPIISQESIRGSIPFIDQLGMPPRASRASHAKHTMGGTQEKDKMPSGRRTSTTAGKQSLQRLGDCERHIASNLSRSIVYNSQPVVNEAVMADFWTGVTALQQKTIEPDSFDATPPFIGQRNTGVLKIGQGLPSGVSILSNTPEPVSSRRKVDRLNGMRPLDTSNLAQGSSPLKQPAVAQKMENSNDWIISKCRICQCWTHAYNEKLKKYAVILNNRIQQHNHGILSRQNQVSTPTTANQQSFYLDSVSAGLLPGSESRATGAATAGNNLEGLEQQFLLLKSNANQ